MAAIKVIFLSLSGIRFLLELFDTVKIDATGIDDFFAQFNVAISGIGPGWHHTDGNQILLFRGLFRSR